MTGARRNVSQRNHRGAVRERSQGLSLRNPWIDSIDELHPGGMREKTRSFTGSFLASLRDALSLHNATRGFEDSTPGYDLRRLRRQAITANMSKLHGAATQRNIWRAAALRGFISRSDHSAED